LICFRAGLSIMMIMTDLRQGSIFEEEDRTDKIRFFNSLGWKFSRDL